MKSGKAKVLVVLGFLAVLLGVVVWAVIGGVQTNQRRSAEAPVQVLDAKQATWTKPGESQIESGYTVRYQYAVGGQTYQGISEENSWYRPGDPVKVCYNPAVPQDHLFTRASTRCGKAVQ